MQAFSALQTVDFLARRADFSHQFCHEDTKIKVVISFALLGVLVPLSLEIRLSELWVATGGFGSG